MTKTAPPGATEGTYEVDATAASGTRSGKGTANCSVTAPPPSLTVTLSVPQPTYPVRSTVPITATVLTGGNPAAGATATFTLTRPKGTSTQTQTTDATGKAVWNYKANQVGTYSVRIQAVYGSQMAVSGSVTFTVQ